MAGARNVLHHAKANWMNIELKELKGEPNEMLELQRVLEEVPDYTNRVNGCPPGPADAQSTYSILPEGKTYDDKFVFGIYLDGQMVGCADVIKDYPDSRTALVGLLAISEQSQKKGIGKRAYRLIEDKIEQWAECDTIRIGIVETNANVIPFWKKCGFSETGEVKPYRYNHIVSQTKIFQKPIKSQKP